MLTYLVQVYDSRLFWLSLAVHDIRRRYRRSLLGMTWAMIQPVLLALILCLVFGQAFQVGTWQYFLYVMTGLCFWNFVRHSVSGGCQSIRSAEMYIQQHRVPLAIYPLRFTLVGGFHFAVAILPLTAVCWLTGGPPAAGAVISLVGAIILLLIFGWSMASIFGVTNVFLPDTQHFTQVFLNLLFYATPIIWLPEMVRQRSFAWIVDYNPLAAFAELIRAPLLDGGSPSSAALGLAAGLTAVAAVLAVLILAWCERRIIMRL